MEYIKPIRNLVMAVTVLGAGLVAGGTVLNEMNKNKQDDNFTEKIELLQKEINSTPTGREMSKMSKMLAEINKEQKQAQKESMRSARNIQTEQEINSALNNANSDLERTAIKAYALVRTTNNKMNDVFEDAIDNIVK